jgi:hypothetical protein
MTTDLYGQLAAPFDFADVKRFLAHFGVRSVGTLTQADFPRAVQLLRQKAAGANGQARLAVAICWRRGRMSIR